VEYVYPKSIKKKDDLKRKTIIISLTLTGGLGRFVVIIDMISNFRSSKID
jgi:hypothetical protein